MRRAAAWMGARLASFALPLMVLAACSAAPSFRSGADRAAADPVEAWLRRAESLRGLRFLQPVAVRPLVRGEIRARMLAELRARMPSGELDAYRDAYAALGVLPAHADLGAIFAEVYAESMIGLYLPRERALYLLEARFPSGYARETVAVHELVHALQHQHAPHTVALSELLRHNDDVVSSLSGVLEGDASFTMLGAEDGDPETERDLASARRFRDEVLVDLVAPTGSLLRAPLAVRLAVTVPYAYGVMLAAHRYGAGGNAALDALIHDAPLSTSELLSEGLEAQASRTTFVRLPLSELARAAPEGCALRHHNVAGSLSLLALFEAQGFSAAQAAELAQGWLGDRFMRVDCSAGAELVWLTIWRSEAAAARFEVAYRSIAPALARNAPLAGAPTARREGSRVLIFTPGVARLAELALAGAELRSYARLSSWVADGCFGEETGCPLAAEAAGRSQHGTAIANVR